jgi:hypothetical protein
VQMMDRYLESLTDEFEARYPHVRDDDKSSLSIPPKLAAFIGRKHDSMGATEVSEEGENQRKYSTQFEHILDFATWLLRRELQSTIGRNPGQDVHQLPQELIQPYETVESELARVKQEAACDRDAS